VPREIKSVWFRYGLAILVYGVIIGESVLLSHYASRVNQSVPIVAGLVVTAWYAGLGPGLLLSILLEATTIYFTPIPQDTTVANAYFGYASVFLVLAIVVVLVSGRKKIESRIRQQSELLQVTLSSIGDAVIATDLEGRISFMNPTAEAMTGWTFNDAKDRTINEVFRIANEIDRDQPVKSPFDLVKEKGSVVGLANHTVLISKDGKETPIDDSGAPIRDAGGRIIGVVIVFHDVSENRKTESERERLLASETKARRDAESANRLKDDFLSTVSHELRTPLNAIIGWSGLLRSGSLPDPGAIENALNVIDRNARAQNKLIDDILDVSSIVSGKMKIDLADVDLVSVLNSALESIEPVAEGKNITITTDYGESRPHVLADKVRLQQVFWNLFSNAVKFTPKSGHVEVSLSVHGSNACVKVSDNGEGIDKNDVIQIFDRFRQLDSSTRRTQGGLGLGLAIVKNLVELHGGRVWAESEGLEQGSTFVVELPVDQTAAVTNTAKNGNGSMPDLSGVKVLVVDDNFDSLEICRLGLEHFGASTKGADSCSAAMDVFTQWRPDFLVSDIGMPGEDGFDLIGKIRSLGTEAGGETLAAAVTAYAREEDQKKALAAGFQTHIPKPVEPNQLAQEIVRLLKAAK
jgi:PAS domain S-box-containing protein